MTPDRNVDWFKAEIAPTLTDFEINYRFFENGDFGSLNQVGFESPNLSGQIDFWGLNYLGIFLYDHLQEEILINVLHWDSEAKEKQQSIAELLNYLK